MSRSRLIECGYAVVLLSCLTFGTVLWFWRDRLADAGAVSDAANWTLVLVQLPALALLVRRHGRRVRSVEWALVGLVGWLAVSVAWSAVPRTTFVDAALLGVTCCVGVYFAVSFSWRELTALVVVGMQPGLILSQLAIQRDWPGAEDPFHLTTGIYGNRNLLGPPAVFAAACGLVLIAVVLGTPWRGRVRALAVAGIAVVVLFDLDLQRQGASVTSWLMLAAFIVALAAMVLVGRVPALRQRPGIGPLLPRLMLAAFAVVFTLAVVFNEPVSRALGRNPGFSSRTDYWSANLDGFIDRPLIGWGWMAAWRTDEFRATLSPKLAVDVFTHSTYFDIALGGGVVAVVLFLVVVYLGAGSAGTAFDRRDLATAIPTAFVVAIAVGSTEESFFRANYFLTALLVAAFTSFAAAARSTAAPDPTALVRELVGRPTRALTKRGEPGNGVSDDGGG